MSILKVQKIRHTASNTDVIDIANDGSCVAKLSNRQGRNLVINGGMNVAQRGTSSTVSGFGSVDRFAVFHSTNDTITQAHVDVSSSDLPYTEAGVTKALKVTNGNQSSAGAAEYVEISYKPEAQDIINSGWKYTSPSSKLTFSCYVRSSIAQTFTAWFTNRDGTRKNYVFSFTLAANTWTKITKTIPGNSGLTINNDNGSAIELFMQMYYGTNYSQANPPGNNTGDWVNHTNQTVETNATDWYFANGATFEMTAVQLEVSDYPTEFEHRSFGQELALCERYYQDSFEYHHLNAQNGESDRWIRFRTEMRASPSVTTSPTNSVSFGVHVTTSNGFSGDGSGSGHANFNLGWTASAEL